MTLNLEEIRRFLRAKAVIRHGIARLCIVWHNDDKVYLDVAVNSTTGDIIKSLRKAQWVNEFKPPLEVDASLFNKE